MDGSAKGSRKASSRRRRYGEAMAQRHGPGHHQRHSEEQIDEPRPSGYAHEKEQAGQHDRTAEIRLQQQEEAEQAGHGEGGMTPRLKVLMRSCLLLMK